MLISKVQPELRTRVAEQVLENYGYFGSRASDSLLHRKHGRKAAVNYTLGSRRRSATRRSPTRRSKAG